MKYNFVVFFVFIPLTLFSQSQNNKYTISDTLSFFDELFTIEKPLELTLKSDFKQFKKDKFKGEYQTAQLSYHLNDTLLTNNIKIKARGKNRKENCSFPPISVNLKKITTNEQNGQFYNLKMVVHCKNNKIFEKFLLKEYLCYKLYSCLSDTSFKVRLLKIKYIDTGYKKPQETSMFAFFIENQNMMAERLNVRLDKGKNYTQIIVNQRQIMELAMFQYMIGNFDWAVPTQQNIKLVRPENAPQEIYAIPYDFDYCGLVNANYAFPNKALGISSVKQRIYLGECKPQDDFLPIIEKFIKTKDEFYELINSFEYLSEKDKKIMIKYLDSFYKLIHLKQFYRNYIKKTCKKIRSD